MSKPAAAQLLERAVRTIASFDELNQLYDTVSKNHAALFERANEVVDEIGSYLAASDRPEGGPIWPDHCNHPQDGYAGSFNLPTPDSLSDPGDHWHDVYVYPCKVEGLSLCVRYGPLDREYISAGGLARILERVKKGDPTMAAVFAATALAELWTTRNPTVIHRWAAENTNG